MTFKVGDEVIIHQMVTKDGKPLERVVDPRMSYAIENKVVFKITRKVGKRYSYDYEIDLVDSSDTKALGLEYVYEKEIRLVRITNWKKVLA